MRHCIFKVKFFSCFKYQVAASNRNESYPHRFILLQIFEYDFTNDAVVCTTADDFVDNLPARFADTTNTAINNILLDENNENVVTLQNDSFLFVLEKDKTSSVHNVTVDTFLLKCFLKKIIIFLGIRVKEKTTTRRLIKQCPIGVL